MLDLTSIPTELLTLFQSEAREAFFELRSGLALDPARRKARQREVLYLLRGNAEALGIRPWVEQIRTAHAKLADAAPGEAEAIIEQLETAVVGSFKEAGWEARREKVAGVPNIYLYPGYVYVSAHPAVVSTVLGSCVSVCLWDEGRRVGGLNHFLLPGDMLTAKYAQGAMQQLVDQFTAVGGRRAGAKAKIVGGARLISVVEEMRTPLGSQNAEKAEAFLRHAGVEIVEKQTGGMRGRKLTFDMKNGATKVVLV